MQELKPDGGMFDNWELELHDDFPLVGMDAVAKAHSQAYIDVVNQVTIHCCINLVNPLSLQVHDSLSDGTGVVAPVPFTPLVQRSLKIPVTQVI